MEGSAKKLIPYHIGGEVAQETFAPEEKGKEKKKGAKAAAEARVPLSAKAVFRQRSRELLLAPQLEDLLKEYAKKHKIEVPETKNLTLVFLDEFRRLSMEAQDLRVVIRETTNADERVSALRLYTEKHKKLQEYLEFGKSFEHAYREFIRSRMECKRFTHILRRISVLEMHMRSPSFSGVPDGTFDERESSRLEQMMRTGGDPAIPADSDLEAALATVVNPEGSEFSTLQQQAKEGQPMQSKKALSDEMTKLRKEAEDLWADPMVRWFYNQKEMEDMLEQFSRGEAVIETQSVIHMLNDIHEWEQTHQRTTLGAVLVGPPGVGKTTLVRHYLAAKQRGYVYMDMSEDVTRYLLYGSKAVEFKTRIDYFRTLVADLENLNETNFEAFVRENAASLKQVFGPKAIENDEVIATFLAELLKSVEAGGETDDPALKEKCPAIKAKLMSLAGRHLRGEIAEQITHVAERPNGYRYGILVSALKNRQSVIVDEFNKTKDMALLFSLLTAEPASDEEAGPMPDLDEKSVKSSRKGWWYFPDNNEWIRVPQNWRMYFTGNIGRKHGGFEVAEALASRASGKVMEVDYPPAREEMSVSLAGIANAEGDILRPKEDLAKLYVLINDVFPKVRSFIEGKRQSIPLSYRTLRDTGEKLLLARDPRTSKPVYQPSGKSFDEALYEILIESYALYEDKTIPKQIVELCTTVGLLLDDRIKDKVLKWVDKTVYDERKKSHGEKKADFDELVNKIRGLSDYMTSADTMPVTSKI